MREIRLVFNQMKPISTAIHFEDNAAFAYADDEAKWRAVLDKDPRADGRFFFSVKTTGVYCRPSCASRPALRKNVGFHACAADAERTGFRPCKRCRPTGPTLAQDYTATVAKACHLITTSEVAPTLPALAKAVGMSPFHFHRVFKAETGVTPKAYAAAQRMQNVRKVLLSRRHTVTSAIYEAGFRSSSRFYAKSSETLGMTPTSFRRGGVDTTIRFAVGECSLGSVLVAASQKGVCAILLGDDPNALTRDLQDRFPKARLVGGDKEFEGTVARVIGFIEAPRTNLDLPLDIRGTVFQRKVWQALREIPPGKTMSYTDIAARVGTPKAVRAVAQACGANALAVAIPCHRVVRHNGNLSGYRWGVQRKAVLLQREATAA